MACAPLLLAAMLLLVGCALPTRASPTPEQARPAATVPAEPRPDGLTPLTVEQDRELGAAPVL